MKITCGNRTIDVEAGMTVMQCLLALSEPTAGVLAVQQEGRVLELYDEVRQSGTLRPLTMQDEEGRRIYERSLRFVALLALRRLLPAQRVRIEYSVGGGVFICVPGHEVTERECQAIKQEMHRITNANMLFDKREWSLDDAIAYFEQEGQPDKVELLKRRTVPFFNMYECGGMWEYFYGAMVPSTWYVRVFDIKHLPGRGFALLLPTAAHPDSPAEYIDRPKHLAVFDQSASWCGILGVKNAPDLHRMMEKGELRSFIRINEELHNRAINEIAEEIVAREKRIILIAGPSSSGKTTFTGRLEKALQQLGRHPVKISLDDYYRNRSELPVEEDGTVDLEGIHTIDVALFREHMIRLTAGETVEIPRFSFKTGEREPQGEPLTLPEGEPVLIEGIHGLNPQLSEGMPAGLIHRVFVSALACINLDDHNRIRTTDARLLRRIVRDNQFRGTSPEETLAMWQSVRRGEEKWIFPYQETADSMFNTALHYELPVMKRYVYDLLKAITPDKPQYLAARRLVKLLNYFPEADDDVIDLVPPHSLLREFIGPKQGGEAAAAPREMLPPFTPETFPENMTLPEGVRTVHWQDSFGFGVAFRNDIVYAQRDGETLHIQYLTPRNDRKDNPLILYVQGSAWFRQDVYIHLPEMIRMCQRGYCVAMVQYRPSTTKPFPAQAEDAKSALRFLRANHEKYRFDPDRVAVWGDSSGGHTALMHGFTGDCWPNHPDDDLSVSAEVRCIVDWYGPTVVSEMAFEPSLIDHASPDCPEGWLIGHLPVQEHPDLADRTVPQNYLSADRPTPPTLIMHGSRDMTVNFQQSVHLYERMRELGKEVEFIKVMGGDHGWRGFACEEALDEVHAFLKKYIG